MILKSAVTSYDHRYELDDVSMKGCKDEARTRVLKRMEGSRNQRKSLCEQSKSRWRAKKETMDTGEKIDRNCDSINAGKEKTRCR